MEIIVELLQYKQEIQQNTIETICRYYIKINFSYCLFLFFLFSECFSGSENFSFSRMRIKTTAVHSI